MRPVPFSLAVLSFFGVFCSCKKTGEESTSLLLTVGAYNVWSVNARSSAVESSGVDPVHLWENSRDEVAGLIADTRYDLLGIEEVDERMLNELPERVARLDPDLAFVSTVTDPEYLAITSGVGMFYRKTRFRLEEKKLFWLSQTPDEPSLGWNEKKRRVALFTELSERKTGARIRMITMHGPLDDETNANAAELVLKLAKQWNPGHLPFFIVGDMNAQNKDPLYATFSSWASDARADAESHGRLPQSESDYPGTYISWAAKDDIETLRKKSPIDYVFLRDTWRKMDIQSYEVLRRRFRVGTKDFFPSDHCPLKVVYRWTPE